MKLHLKQFKALTRDLLISKLKAVVQLGVQSTTTELQHPSKDLQVSS